MNIVEAMRDPKLFGPWCRDQATWLAWQAFLSLLWGLPMTPEMEDACKACTGLEELPTGGFNEAWLVVGRRGGKSLIMAMVAVYVALFRDWSGYLVPGERGVVLVIAADRRQAQSIMSYATALLTEVKLLKGKVQRFTETEIELKGRICIEIGTASFRSVRGRTLIAALLDEIAFFRSDESANPDEEILAAIRPGMASIPNALLLCASSPYAKKGAMWEAHKSGFGVPGSTHLVWQAATRTMNPTIPQSYIDAEMRRDPEKNRAELLAQFRCDIAEFISEEVVRRCTVPDRFELMALPGVHYAGFVDPSGGSADAMTLAIAHQSGSVAVLDAVREIRPPFSPENVVIEFAMLLKMYGIRQVVGDRYAGEWPRERFKTHGIHYELSELTKSEIYLNVLPLLNSGGCELLDNPRLAMQLVGLERRTARGGRDTIDHAPRAHDDVVNAAAGALLLVNKPQARGARRIQVNFMGR